MRLRYYYFSNITFVGGFALTLRSFSRYSWFQFAEFIEMDLRKLLRNTFLFGSVYIVPYTTKVSNEDARRVSKYATRRNFLARPKFIKLLVESFCALNKDKFLLTAG